MTIGDAEDRQAIARMLILFVTGAAGLVTTTVVAAVAYRLFIAVSGV